MKRKFPLHWQILTGLIFGVIYGGGVSIFVDTTSLVEAIQEFTAHWVKPWGTIFVNSLQLIAVPLVLFSLVNGIAGLKDFTLQFTSVVDPDLKAEAAQGKSFLVTNQFQWVFK